MKVKMTELTTKNIYRKRKKKQQKWKKQKGNSEGMIED